MKKIFRIATIELSTLFYSPIAWLLLIVFFIQCAMSYTDSMQNWITIQELGGNYKEQMIYLTTAIFGFPTGMLGGVSANLYLFIPLLTMGLISREISSGTIKLLYSSPVKVTDIVMGKFFAIGSYSFLLTMVFGVFLFLGTFHLENADIGLIFSILLAVLLLLAAYGAIGLFLSCLTSYQVVAAISTFVLFAFLNYIGGVWQDVDLVRDITYSLTLSGRVGNMGGGLITSKDLFYFLSVIYIFLGLSILKLKATRSTDSGLRKAMKYIGVVLSGVIIGFVTSRPTLTLYLDATETKVRTLTKTSQEIIRNMNEGPLEVTSYINLLDDNYWNGVPQARNNDLERWLPYIRFKPDLKLKYVYYYDSVLSNDYFHKQYPGKSLDEIADIYTKSFRIRKSFFKTPAEIRKIIDLRPEQNRYVMQLKYKDKATYLRLYDDPLIFPTERETGAALKRLIVKLPKVAFLEGELERSAMRAGDKDYKRMTSQITFRYALVNQGFDFTTISLKNGEIPPGIAALVIADPRAEFEPAVLEKINRYIDNGGNLMIMGEPDKISVLNPLLQKLGIRMMEGLIVQQSADYSPSLTFNYMTTAAAGFSRFMQKAMLDSGRISMPTVAGLNYDSTIGFDVKPLLMTDERVSWKKMAPLSSDSLKVSFASADGDQQGKFATMLSLKRKLQNGKEQRIIVSADADFMSTMELNRWIPGISNFMFNTSLFGWLSNGEFPIDVTRPDSKDRKIFLKGDDVPLLKLILVWIVPAILILIGSIILLRRKRQ